MPNPRFPVFIASKGRWQHPITMRALAAMQVPYRVLVEEAEASFYALAVGSDRVLVLPKRYQDEYETCDELGDTKSKGPGPARNYAWDLSVEEGYPWHWVMDDNIRYFYRRNYQRRLHATTGTVLHAMEEFTLRYENIALAGPQYDKFVPDLQNGPPFILNTRIYSCILVRNDLPYRWRGRYNEDTDLSLRALKDGWATVCFHAFLQGKITTQTLAGGNTDEFYSREGTLPKSRMLVRMHPDVARLVWRYGRWHHQVNYRSFQHAARNQLRFRPDYVPEAEPNEMGMDLKVVKDVTSRRVRKLLRDTGRGDQLAETKP